VNADGRGSDPRRADARGTHTHGPAAPDDGLRSIAEHLAIILEAASPLESYSVPVSVARGRTLREPVTALVDIPVFDNSAMDGFAVLYDDVALASPQHPVTLTVVADLPAGTELDPPLAHGQAARIMTGSPAPTAATAVVPFEDTVDGLADSLGRITVVRAPRAPGAHIRRRGEDAAVGDELLPAGTIIGALQAAAAAAAGVADVVVTRLARVAVVSTGSELAPPGAPLRRGQIPESNSELLAGLAAEAGAEVVLRATVPDDGDGPRDVIAQAQAIGADVVVFSGGVSAGAYEVVKNTLTDVMTFAKVRMQPGKPQGFGASDGMLLFGLPGNPVSAAVSFEVFVRPALLSLQGRTDLHRPVIRLTAASGWRTPAGRTQYLPIAIDRSDPAAWRAVPATGGGSHLAGGLGRAEAYAIIPAEVDSVVAGDLVDVMLIS
jgi:molybdopterin molybdotransferase